MKHTKRFYAGIISGALAFSISPVIADDARGDAPLARPDAIGDGIPREGSMDQVQQERSRFSEAAAPSQRFGEQADADVDRSAVTETDRVVVERDGSLAAESSHDRRDEIQKRTEGNVIDDSAALRAIRASDMLGWDIVDSKGKKVGDLTDFAMRPGSHEVPYAVVTSGGVLGIGGKDRLVELTSLERVGDEGHLRLSNAEAFSGDPSDPKLERQQNLVRFFGDLEGDRVSGTEGGEIGTIEDILLHFKGGSMAYVVVDPRATKLATGDWPANYRAAIPASLVQFTEDSSDITLDISESDLRGLNPEDDLEAIDLMHNSTARIYSINVDALAEAGMAQATPSN